MSGSSCRWGGPTISCRSIAPSEHRRPVLNGYSGYFAPHYWALQYLLVPSRSQAALAILTCPGPSRRWSITIRLVAGDSLAFSARYPYSEVVSQGPGLYGFSPAQATSSYALPEFSGQPLAIKEIRASLYQDLVGRMTDGDRISRWHTGGPQDPTNEVIIDLGSSKPIEGLEMQICGYVADFPRALTIELSNDELIWQSAWTGSPAEVALIGALKEPVTVPLRFVLKGQAGRYIRLRQTSSDPVFYWSIAELRVVGN